MAKFTLTTTQNSSLFGANPGFKAEVEFEVFKDDLQQLYAIRAIASRCWSKKEWNFTPEIIIVLSTKSDMSNSITNSDRLPSKSGNLAGGWSEWSKDVITQSLVVYPNSDGSCPDVYVNFGASKGQVYWESKGTYVTAQAVYPTTNISNKIEAAVGKVDTAQPVPTVEITKIQHGLINFKATADSTCSKWEYRVDTGSWKTFSTTSSTSATGSATVLGGIHSISVRVTKVTNEKTGTVTSNKVDCNYPTISNYSLEFTAADKLKLQFTVDLKCTYELYTSDERNILTGNVSAGGTVVRELTLTSTGKKDYFLKCTRGNPLATSIYTESAPVTRDNNPFLISNPVILQYFGDYLVLQIKSDARCKYYSAAGNSLLGEITTASTSHIDVPYTALSYDTKTGKYQLNLIAKRTSPYSTEFIEARETIEVSPEKPTVELQGYTYDTTKQDGTVLISYKNQFPYTRWSLSGYDNVKGALKVGYGTITLGSSIITSLTSNPVFQFIRSNGPYDEEAFTVVKDYPIDLSRPRLSLNPGNISVLQGSYVTQFTFNNQISDMIVGIADVSVVKADNTCYTVPFSDGSRGIDKKIVGVSELPVYEPVTVRITFFNTKNYLETAIEKQLIIYPHNNTRSKALVYYNGWHYATPKIYMNGWKDVIPSVISDLPTVTEITPK